jgi:hypothetical protein
MLWEHGLTTQDSRLFLQTEEGGERVRARVRREDSTPRALFYS